MRDIVVGPFRLDTGSNLLLRGDEPVALGNRAIALLRALVEQPGVMVSKDALIEAGWPGQIVEESNLTVQIAALRRVFATAPDGDRWIETLPRRGYRFIGPVVTDAQKGLTVSASEPTPLGPAPAESDSTEVTSFGTLPAEAVAPLALPDKPSITVPAVANMSGEFFADGRPPLAGYVRLGARTFGAAASIVIVAAIGAVVWWAWQHSAPPVPVAQTPASQTAEVAAEPKQAPRLSIVVLPFANRSGDPEQQYFADGITEDLTTDLSRIVHMLVISRNTAFTYKDKPINAKQIGRELGVRYILEGSVQRSGNEIRVNAQLVDAETDTHLWAERFDRDMRDLFALQNEVTHRIALALNSELVAAEAGRPIEHPDMLDYILRGRATAHNGITPASFAQAIDLFEHALALEPQSVEAKTRLAEMLSGRVLAGMTNTRDDDIVRAEDLIEQVLAASPNSTGLHYAKGQLLRAKGRFDEAIPEFEALIASDRNSSGAYFALGVCKFLTGAIDEAIPLEEEAIRLNPRDPVVFNRYLVIGEVHLVRSRTDEAIAWLDKARIGNPRSPWAHIWLTSAYALKGETDRAAAELLETRKLLGDGVSSIAAMRANYFRTQASNIYDLYETTFWAGLRKAGVPEE
jgi:adenylate cyclase